MTDQTATTEVADPKPGSAEYDAKMAKIAQAARSDKDNVFVDTLNKDGVTTQVDKPVKPDHVPDKFWDAEKGVVKTDDLLKSYTELETKQGGEKKPADPLKVPDKTTEPDSTGAPSEAKDVVSQAGLKWDDLVAKVAEKGDIEDADYVALEKAGVKRELAKEHIELLAYRRAQEGKAAVEYIGGQEKVDQLMQWAATNLNESEKAKYNELLSGSDWRVGVDALQARRSGASKTAKEPNLEGGSPNGERGTVGYASKVDMTADMRNPLYRDPSSKGAQFRAQVAARVAVSQWRSK